jgi:hypothetical protein
MWDAEEVRKYAHMDSVTPTTANEDDSVPSSSKSKAKSKSRKHARNESGSDTEHETGRDIQVISVISSGIDGLVLSRKEASSILNWQLELATQKEACEREAHNTKLVLDTRGAQILEFSRLSELLLNPNPLVVKHAEELLKQLDFTLAALPGVPAPALVAQDAPEPPRADQEAPVAGQSVQPVASGSGTTSADPA